MKFRYIYIQNRSPFDHHLIDGLQENGHSVRAVQITDQSFKKYRALINTFFADKDTYDATCIGYSAPHLAIVSSVIAFIKGERVIFNAVHSQYEANIISRKVNPLSLTACKHWLIDVLSIHLSWKTLLESNAQIEYVHQLTSVPRHKLLRSFTGVNEKDFFIDTTVAKLPTFTVLFRGRFLAESGIETVVKAAHILDGSGIQFRIIGHGHLHVEYNQLLKELQPHNIEELTKTLPMEILRQKMQECHVSLGQVADNARLDRTLPCKLFESLALELPYLTGRNKGALELLTEGKDCMCVNPGDAQDLAHKIVFLRDHPDILKKIAVNGHLLYQQKLTSAYLANQLVKACFN